jgi:hypothetical protein
MGAKPPRRFVFVLLDHFTLLCFAGGGRGAAHRQPHGRPRALFLANPGGEGGETVRCSAGTEFKLDMATSRS